MFLMKIRADGMHFRKIGDASDTTHVNVVPEAKYADFEWLLHKANS
jgi:hypothetical protein